MFFLEHNIGIVRHVVGEGGFLFPDRSRAQDIAERCIATQGEALFDECAEILCRTGRGNRDDAHVGPIHNTYPGHTEPAVLHRDAARLLEKLVAPAHPHDKAVDPAQHRIDSAQPLDPLARPLHQAEGVIQSGHQTPDFAARIRFTDARAEVPAAELRDDREDARCLAAYAPVHQQPRSCEDQERGNAQDRK